MTTIARNFEALCFQYPCEDNYRVVPNGFVNAWRQQAVKVEYPLGTDSFDSTERWTFRDGSKVEVQNPSQAAFILRINVVRNED